MFVHAAPHSCDDASPWKSASIRKIPGHCVEEERGVVVSGPTEKASTRQRKQNAEVMRALRALVTCLRRSARGVEQSSGVTNAQLFILQELARSEPRSIGELAMLALTQQSTVSLVVSRLERAGLVQRARAPENARRTEVTLTSAGRRVVRNAPVPPMTAVIAAVNKLEPEQFQALRRGLKALTAALGIKEVEPHLLFEASDASVREASPRSRRGSR
jgi:DNA-binding MarR family transcriptional regulator